MSGLEPTTTHKAALPTTRINLTLYKIDAITEGDMDELINALATEHQADLLATLGDDN